MGKEIEICSYFDIPDYTGLNNNTLITVKDGHTWNGDRHGSFVGRIESDGEVISYFKKDKENNNTYIFDKLREDVQLCQRSRTYAEGKDLKFATDYYIPYYVKNHSSQLATVTDSYVDHCSNAEYKVAYEVLFVAEDDFRKYLTIEYTTKGHWSSCFFDQVESLRDDLQGMFEDGENGFLKKDGQMTAEFYDGAGYGIDLELESIDELVSMIASIRVIKLETEIVD